MELRTRMGGLRSRGASHVNRIARVLGVLAAVGLGLVVTPVASASTSFT